MNIHDRDEFAEAFAGLDATKEPGQIREPIEPDQRIELTSKQTGKGLYIEKGEIKQVDSQ